MKDACPHSLAMAPKDPPRPPTMAERMWQGFGRTAFSSLLPQKMEATPFRVSPRAVTWRPEDESQDTVSSCTAEKPI